MAGCKSTERTLVHCKFCGKAWHFNRVVETAGAYRISTEIIWLAFKAWGCTALHGGDKPCERPPVVSAQFLAAIRRRYERCQS